MNKPSTRDLKKAAYRFLAGGGEMARLVQEKDWSSTALGPLHQWPQSLRTILGTCLTSTLPSIVLWGDDLIHFHNDACAAILRSKYLPSFGTPAEEVWTDVWNEKGPFIRNVFTDGKASSWKTVLSSSNNSSSKYADFTFHYSPVYNEADRVSGVYCIICETDQSVISQ